MSERVANEFRDREPPEPPSATHEDAAGEERSWVWTGIASGLVGATVIAVFFLAIDVGQGQPFRTPGVLGGALFLGEPLAAGETPMAVVVTAYTVLHGVLFLSLGSIAAFFFIEQQLPRPHPASGLIVAVSLFASFEVIFLAFGVLMTPGLIEEFGVGTTAAANLLAAIAMSWVVVSQHTRHAPDD